MYPRPAAPVFQVQNRRDGQIKKSLFWLIAGSFLLLIEGNSLVLHCASLLRTIFASLVRAHERVRIQNLRDFPQTKLNGEINAPFLSNELGDPRFFGRVFAKNSLIKNIFEEGKKFGSKT